jgi:Na+/H+ antiporter NhaD/arsenite permease-like protein
MLYAIISSAIFLFCLYLIFSEKLDRLIAATLGAALMVTAGLLLGFYTQEQALSSIDFNTLGLLFGMMLLVALLEPTGFFQYLAVWAARLSNGRPLRLLIMLGFVTSVLSMFLDNVTTVVLIAPVTILICEILGIAPAPFLISEALLSNTGGTATLVGDPPNVLIASTANLSFTDFLMKSLPVVILVWIAAVFLLRYLFRAELSQTPKNQEALLNLNPVEALNDPRSAARVLLILAATLLAFLFQENLQVAPAVIALLGAIAALVWVRPPVKELFQRIEWSVLFFFLALFILVGGLEYSGVLHSIATFIVQARNLPPVVFGVITLWGVALISAVVDNIPITIALLPVVAELGELDINITPLWWALVFGAGFGGNGSILGSTANIVVVTLSERTRLPITSNMWSRRGLPVMLATCLVATVLYIILYPWLSR